MLGSIFPSKHQQACNIKQQERQSQIEKISVEFSHPLSSSEDEIHALSLSDVVLQCRSGKISPSQVMKAYGKKAFNAQEATNCISDFMFEEALKTNALVNWTPTSAKDELNQGLSLMGVPVSIKDTFDILNHDTTIGLSRNVSYPAKSSSAIVRLLQDAGALIHVKTTVPTGLLSMETSSDLFGRTLNRYNPDFTPGGSTGGGGALLACGGSKIEIGSDIGGSVRIPAHFCGVWAIKCSAGRMPSWGHSSAYMGLEGVDLVASPMAANFDDLEEFCKRVVMAKPWLYDHTCIPLPWRPVNLEEEGRKLKWGVMWDDGVTSPTPACKRALSLASTALQLSGHEVIEFHPPDPSEGILIGFQLLFSDGGAQMRDKLSPYESLNAAAKASLDLLKFPRIVKNILSFFTGDKLTRTLMGVLHEKTVKETQQLVMEREKYRAAWHKKWAEEGLDFLLTMPHPLPAFEHGESAKVTFLSVTNTFLFNILDYTAGVLPVTSVDKTLDALPQDYLSSPEFTALGDVGKGGYSVYDAEKMHGLPLGVQVVGRRLEEEKVLQGMRVVEAALALHGGPKIGKPAV